MKITNEQKSKNKIPKTNKGITLIALVITVVVMLILVAVTISMAVNGGLFDYAGKASGETKNALNVEQKLSEGAIQVDGVWYDSIDDYLAGEPSGSKEIKISYDYDKTEGIDTTTVNLQFEIEGIPTYEEFAEEYMKDKEEELEALLPDFYKIVLNGVNVNDIEEVEAFGAKITGYSNFDELLLKELNMTKAEFVEYAEAESGLEYKYAILLAASGFLSTPKLIVTISNGETIQVSYDDLRTSFTVKINGTYTVTAIGANGEKGETKIQINNLYEEKFSSIYTETKPYTDGNGDTATIPAGFSVGTSEGINKVDTGLVIRDANGNEFVWIPIEDDLGSSYSVTVSINTCNEPKELTGTWSDSTLETKPKYDSQEILDELYGANYYTYSEDFKYAEEYAKMVEKVNQYNGFYIGRYETTIDSDGNIGTEYNTPVLTAATTLFTKDSANYPYRWYGLYQAGKNADVSGNGTDVQTAMIYGVLYDEAMQFIRDQKAAGKTTYDVDTATSSWHTGSTVVNSGHLNPGETGDVALNIWDLESNAYEWTQETVSTYRRASRGGCCNIRSNASNRDSIIGYPIHDNTYSSSRLALYIK